MSSMFDDDGDQSTALDPRGAGLETDEIVRCLDESDDGLLILDDDGCIRYANREAREALGGTRKSEVVGRQFGRPLETGDTDRLELVTASGRTRTVDIHATRVTDVELGGWVMVLRDVKDDADGLALAYHELRNTLTSMVGAVEALQDDWDTGPATRRHGYLDLLQRKIGRMARTVDGYLTSARTQTGALEPRGQRTDVLTAVADYLQSVGIQDEKPEIRIPVGLPVWIDPSHLQAILDNLVTNATKYARSPIVVRAEVDQALVHIEVLDRGPGVPLDLRDRLFERFTRDDSEVAVAGSGLGLWVARSLAEAYGGSLVYRDRTGGGSCFRLTLPAIEAGSHLGVAAAED